MVLEMALSSVGRRVPALREAMLTDRRLLFRQALPSPAVTIIDRADITALEVFAGDDTVLVHGRDGILHRDTVPGNALHLARVAGATTALWRSRLPGGARHYLALRPLIALFSSVVAIILFMGAILFYPAMIDGAIARIPKSWLPENVGEQLAAVVAGCLVLGVLAGYLVGWVLAHKAMAVDELRALRCWKFHPLWQGLPPPSRLRQALAAPGRAIRVALDRAFWGPAPNCDAIKPEIIQPDEWDRIKEDDWQHPLAPWPFR